MYATSYFSSANLIDCTFVRLMEQARREGLNREQIQARLKEQKQALDTAVSMADFTLALSKVNKSVGDQDLARYREWMDEFGSA